MVWTLSFWQKVITFMDSAPAIVFVPLLATNGSILYDYLILLLRLSNS